MVHQFVDGGTWANYPSFVFQDRSFRAWLRSASQARGQWADTDDEAWQREANRPVVGFILGNPEPLERRQAAGLVPLRSADVNRRFDQGPTYTSPKRPVYLVGAVLSSDWARLLVGLAMAVWVALSLATMPVGVRRFSTWLAGWLPDWLYPVALVGTLSMVVLAAVVAIGLMAVLVLVGRLVADTLLPSMQALIGVPTSVAPWIGLGDDSVVLRVPHIGLKTTDFAVTDAARLAAVKAAHQCVCAQLDDATTSARLEALFSGVPGPAEQLRLEPSTAAPAVSPNEVSLGGILAAVIATAVVGGLGWWGTNSAGIAGIEVITLAVVGGLLVGGAALVYVGGRAGTRSATRARYGVGASARRPHRAGVVAIVAGVAALVAGAALSMVTMDDRADDTREAKVLSAQAGTGSDDNDADHDDNKDDNNNDNNTYIVAVEGLAAPVTVISDRHLRLSEAVFVRLDAGAETARLVGALDDGRFGVAVVCWMLGLGLITSGVRRRRWDTMRTTRWPRRAVAPAVRFRRARRLHRRSAADHIVQGLWIGDRLGVMQRCSIRSFLAAGHPYHLYTYGPVEGVPAGVTVLDANALIPADRIWRYRDYDTPAGFSNQFRYHLLDERGGTWADLDVICLRPLPDDPYLLPAQTLAEAPAATCLLRAARIGAAATPEQRPKRSTHERPSGVPPGRR